MEVGASAMKREAAGVHPRRLGFVDDPQSLTGIIFQRINVRCKMFRSLTHYDAVLAFGGNIHCLPTRVGRSRNSVGVKRATVFGKL